MKTLTLELPDELYERVEHRAAQSGSTPDQEVLDLIARSTDKMDDEALSAARSQMRQLFQTVKGFRLGVKIPREELHDCRRLR